MAEVQEHVKFPVILPGVIFLRLDKRILPTIDFLVKV